PPRTRVPVTRKSRCASAIDFANPALTPSSSPSNTNAMTMENAVRIVRVGLRHRPAQTSGKNFTLTPIPCGVLISLRKNGEGSSRTLTARSNAAQYPCKPSQLGRHSASSGSAGNFTMALPETEQLTRMLATAALSRAICTLAELGVADHIQSGTPQPVETLARLTGAHE